MGIKLTMSRTTEVAGLQEVTKVITFEEALLLFSALTHDAGANITVRFEQLSETSFTVYNTYSYGPLADEMYKGVSDANEYGYTYRFEAAPRAHLDHFDRLLMLAVPFMVFYPRICAPEVSAFIAANVPAMT